METLLRDFTKNRPGLYLDSKKNNRPARKGKKLSWEDGKGNLHDLDFVIEKNGTNFELGTPVAFIESAWRRYTKHSRNKAQEIQAAILPLAEKYALSNPFLGVVLAGEFTEKSLRQLQSCDFSVLHIPYHQLISSFRSIGLDVTYGEQTPDENFIDKIPPLATIKAAKKKQVHTSLKRRMQTEIDLFFTKLHRRFHRLISRVVVLPLYGYSFSFPTAYEAVAFLNQTENFKCKNQFVRFEILLSFSNGDEMRASFEMKPDAIDFLMEFIN